MNRERKKQRKNIEESITDRTARATAVVAVAATAAAAATAQAVAREHDTFNSNTQH